MGKLVNFALFLFGLGLVAYPFKSSAQLSWQQLQNLEQKIEGGQTKSEYSPEKKLEAKLYKLKSLHEANMDNLVEYAASKYTYTNEDIEQYRVEIGLVDDEINKFEKNLAAQGVGETIGGILATFYTITKMDPSAPQEEKDSWEEFRREAESYNRGSRELSVEEKKEIIDGLKKQKKILEMGMKKQVSYLKQEKKDEIKAKMDDAIEHYKSVKFVGHLNDAEPYYCIPIERNLWLTAQTYMAMYSAKMLDFGEKTLKAIQDSMQLDSATICGVTEYMEKTIKSMQDMAKNNMKYEQDMAKNNVNYKFCKYDAERIKITESGKIDPASYEKFRELASQMWMWVVGKYELIQ